MPIRKKLRLINYDYSLAGAYFITICTAEMKPTFGKVVVGDAAHGVPIMELNTTGKIVKQYIENINTVYKHTHLDKYVIMPNHVHLIITVSEKGTPWAAYPTTDVPKIINSLKTLTSKKAGSSLWQRSYHDRIIRNEAEYRKIWQYIDESPTKWVNDKYYV